MKAERRRLLVMLLGGRPQAAQMTALHLNPNTVLCICSADMKQGDIDHVTTWLAGKMPEATALPAYKVSAYRLSETRDAIEKAVAAMPDAEVIISLTGAPMPMVVGACDAARTIGCPAYYLNTAAGELIDLMRGDVNMMPLQLSVQDFVALHPNAKIQEVAQPAGAALRRQGEALVALARDFAVLTPLLHWMATPTKEEKESGWRLWRLNAEHRTLLEELVSGGLISPLTWRSERGHQRISYQVQPEHQRFLGGVWLEQHVYAVAQELTEEGVFDDCRWSMHLVAEGDAEREIDVICVRRGVGLIVSCKTSAKECWQKRNLDELTAVAKPLGADYCTKLYVTNQPRPRPQYPFYKAYVHFLGWANEQGVKIVTGDELADLGRILTELATKPPGAR